MGKAGVNEFTGQDEKLTPDKKMILNSHYRYQGADRDYYSNFLVIFQAASKSAIVCGRFILGKVGVDRFTGPQREINIKYKFDFELLWMILGCK